MSLALLRIWRAPAVQALLLQVLAYPLTLIVVFLLQRAGMGPGLEGALLVQGGLACALARFRRMAPWWLGIELVFPLALVQALSLQLPPLMYLGVFIILLLVFWSTFRTQVPYYPSGPWVWNEVARLLPQDRPVYAIDIGSGLGGLVLELARRRPESTFVGIELAPLPWLASRLRARLAASRARFVRGDYEHLNFADYDAVFAYLSPAAMSALWQKASREMRPGAILLSYEFLITEKAPDISIVPTGRGAPLYVWHF